MKGIKYVIFFSFLGFFLGLLLAALLTLFHFNPYTQSIIKIYISIFRGIPLVCQIAALIYLFPTIFPISSICLLTFSLNSSAYLLEVFKLFIYNMPKEEIETAIGLGFNKYKIIKKIIFPQMFRNSIPLFIAEIISIAKNVSILGTFGILEIFRRGTIIASADYNYGRSMILVGIVYYFITFLMGKIENLPWIKNLQIHG